MVESLSEGGDGAAHPRGEGGGEGGEAGARAVGEDAGAQKAAGDARGGAGREEPAAGGRVRRLLRRYAHPRHPGDPHPADPVSTEGGVAVLRGNLAPGGAAVKHLAADPELQQRIDDPDEEPALRRAGGQPPEPPYERGYGALH
ncbi:hypothetical protein KNE206_63480 [Kitasatospora sp. NE20-6]